MIIDGIFNHAKLTEFFEAWVSDVERKVFIIHDNLGGHHCTIARHTFTPGESLAGRTRRSD
jgi:hypothetical protein